MKVTKYFFTLLIAICLGGVVQAQDPLNLVVQKGSSLPINIPIEGMSMTVANYPLPGNLLEFLEAVESPDSDVVTYKYLYTPDPAFEGQDGFTLQEIISLQPVPMVENFVFLVDVVSSEVNTADDFVRFSSDDMITINPLANDASSASDMNISIVQVMFGTAEVNDDQTISYTPGEGDRDYIVYNATDMYGTAASATIYLQEDNGLMQDDTNDAFSLAAGKGDYIFLPDATYEASTDTLMHGELLYVADHVYRYVSNADGEGDDEFTFVNGEGAIHTVIVSVISQYVDDGFVRDDVFYGAKNTMLIFNVKDNDVITQTAISDYSEELLHIGNGKFAYTPDPDFAGVVELFYEADNGMEDPEIGSIKLIIENFEPISNITYELATPKNQPRVIEYAVPLNSEFFGIEDFPEHGTIEVFDDSGTVTIGCAEEVQKLFAVYTPNGDYVGTDAFTLRYCASDNNFCKNVDINVDVVDTDVDACVCVDDCVWPGDANADGVVNMRDMLAIGGNLGASGPVREQSPYAGIYDGAEATSWAGNLANGTSIAHVDADGDGQVAVGDLSLVADNYGEVHSIVARDLFGVKDIPFGFINDTDVEVGELKTIEIYAGSDAFPAVDMRGIAFSVSLPASSVDVSTLQVQFVQDNYFVKNAPFVSMIHMAGNGLVHAGGIKTNALGSTGSGVIGSLSFIVVEDAEGIRPHLRSTSNGEEIITVELFDITYEGADGMQYALPSTSIDLVVRRDEKENTERVSISPNPSQEVATIALAEVGEIVTGLQVYSMSGNLLHRSQPNSVRAVLDISQWAPGVYMVQVQSAGGVETAKLIKG